MSLGKSVPTSTPVRNWLPVLLFICGALLYGALAVAGSVYEGDPPGRVARVNLLDGRGSLQLAGSETWVDDLVNRPLTGGDRLWIESGARAEVHIGSTVLRLGASTALQFIALDDRAIRLRLSAGSLSVRVRQLAVDEVFNIETPAGDVELLDAGGYRLNVTDRDEQARVVVWSGRVRVQGTSGAQVLHANESAEMFGGDQRGLELAAAGATDSLDLWAEDRDRREDNSRSARYVSREVVGYEELDGYGDWVVDPLYGSVWVPQHVIIGWAPYRFGYWNWIGPWGWTWIDDAPWGFAPCHYGRWVHRYDGWGWAPGPVHEHRPVFAPALVAWVDPRPGHGRHDERRDSREVRDPHDMPRVGWVPLGYNEVYRPPYHASRNYLQAANASNTHLDRGAVARALDQDRDADLPGGERGQHRYAHQAVPGALTTVSRDTFVSARPVGHNRLEVDGTELGSAPLSTGVMDIKPGAHSFGRESPRDRPVSRPDRALFERPMPVTGQSPAARPSLGPVLGSGTSNELRDAVSRSHAPIQQRGIEPVEPASHSMDRPVENSDARQVERSPRTMPMEQRAPQPQYSPPVPHEPAPLRREWQPPVRAVPREAPQAREAPQPYAPPPRPVMVNPPQRPAPSPERQYSPPHSQPQVRAPPASAPAPNNHVDRGDRNTDHERR